MMLMLPVELVTGGRSGNVAGIDMANNAKVFHNPIYEEGKSKLTSP